VQNLRAPRRHSRLQWLFHSCLAQLDVGPAVRITQQLLEEIGWDTPSSWARRLPIPSMVPGVNQENEVATEPAAPSPDGRPWALIAGTDSPQLQLERLNGAPAIIFVLDTNPNSLLKTYQQIKLLVGQRPDWDCRFGALFVSPADRGRQRMVASCRRHLGIALVDLGTVPRGELEVGTVGQVWDPLVGKPERPFEALQRSPRTLEIWRQVIRRGLYGL